MRMQCGLLRSSAVRCHWRVSDDCAGNFPFQPLLDSWLMVCVRVSVHGIACRGHGPLQGWLMRMMRLCKQAGQCVQYHMLRFEYWRALLCCPVAFGCCFGQRMAATSRAVCLGWGVK